MKGLITILSVVMVVVGCKEQSKQITTPNANKIIDTVIFKCVEKAPDDYMWNEWVEYKGKNYTEIDIKYDTIENHYYLIIWKGEIVGTSYSKVNNKTTLEISYTPTQHPKQMIDWALPGIMIYQY